MTKSPDRDDKKKTDDKSEPPPENPPWTGDWGSNVEVRKEVDQGNVEDMVRRFIDERDKRRGS